MTPEQFAARKALYDDFPLYARHVLKIRTKAGEVAPLALNDAQRILQAAIEKQERETNRVRVIVLKARQQGLSTMIGGWLFSRTTQRKAKRSIVVAHKADSTRALFDMTKRYYDNCPDAVRPETRYSSRKELSFPNLDSSYVVATAGGDSIARGETISDAHLSELAFWPAATRAENFNALMQSIPNAPGTSVFIESTANGVSGLFYEMWQGAVAGDNGFVPVFIPWFVTKEYRVAAAAPLEHTPEEEALVADYGLDDEQLAFRRQKIAQNGRELFMQEYPASAEEAFLTSGRPVFNPEQLARMLRDAPEPIARLALEGEEWRPHSRGELLCYAEHDPGATYYIGADVGMGVQRDWSVAQVLDGAGRQVAVYRAQAHPDYYATVLAAMGRFYNDARLIIESNNHGLTTLNVISKYLDTPYDNLFTEVAYDKITDRETVRLGFSTTVKSKPLIIDKLRAAIRDGTCAPVDRETLRELQSYIVNEEGKMEAEPGCHDDCVMSLALANHIQEGNYVPITNDASWYVREGSY